MAMEDFEWQGDVELTEPSRVRQQARQTPPGLLGRVRHSVWFEPALRLGGMALLLSVLAGIGVVATTHARPGFDLPDGPRGAALALGTSWLKSAPGAPASPAAGAANRGEAAHTPAAAPTDTAVAAASASSQPAVPTEPPSADNPPGITADGKVILNRASAEELTKLPGVGMKRAQAIVALRTKLKRFKQPSDLLRVKGIGPRGLQRMLPHLVLDGPA